MLTSTEPIQLRLRDRVLAVLKRVVPILVSVFILYYYFHDKEWDSLWAAAQRSNLWLALLAIIIPQLIFWFVETLLVERHMTWFHGPFPFWTLFWVRGAIYILTFINPILGGGGFLLYMQRKAVITWAKLMGIVLFRIGLMLWGMAVIMVPATLALYHYDLVDKININIYVWWGFLIFGVLYMINGWMTWHHGTHFGLSKIVVRDRDSDFWTAFRIATKKQWYLTWAMSLPPFIITVLGVYFLAIAFNIKIPFLEFMVVGPLMLLLMDLPIAFGGFGTATLAWEVFFKGYGNPEDALTLTLFLPLVRALLRSVIGAISLQPALKDINKLFGNPEPAP